MYIIVKLIYGLNVCVISSIGPYFNNTKTPCSSHHGNIYIVKTPAALLALGHSIRSIARLRKPRRPIIIPLKLLRPNRPRAPSIRRISHPVIHNPALTAIGRRGEGSMTDTICRFARVLVEHGVRVFAPVCRVHWVVAYKFELSETVVAVV